MVFMLRERNEKGVKGECIFSGNLVEHAARVDEMVGRRVKCDEF